MTPLLIRAVVAVFMRRFSILVSTEKCRIHISDNHIKKPHLPRAKCIKTALKCIVIDGYVRYKRSSIE